jgi:phosphoribosyl-AMP cyclohydrolase / phosphoribosyl-ATP pyrophosphohydrolase
LRRSFPIERTQSAKAPEDREEKKSYVVSLFDEGINKIAQKVGRKLLKP